MQKKLQIWGMNRSTKLLFSYKELLDEVFLETDLGKLSLAIPFDELVEKIPPPKQTISGRGCKPWFDLRGGIALQFLKHYLGVSDEMIIERLNSDWSMQMFCGIMLQPGERIKDTNLVSHWRVYLGKHLSADGMVKMDELQKVFADYWKPNMENTQVGSQDATCYEGGIRYPTDVKLLWECCIEVYNTIQGERQALRLRKSRSKFDKKRLIVLKYLKSRKKSKREEKKLRKFLLKFLHRLLELLNELCSTNPIYFSDRKSGRLHVIENIYKQQFQRAYGDQNEPIKDRIVSLYKPYVRPIKRGKEVKPVEFGAKVNKLQVDGISFIEHLSFDNFNETTRFSSGVNLQRKLFGKCTHQSADKIYATNKNRKYSSSQKIQTNFVPKGKEKQEYKEQSAQIRSILNKERSTVLEGSFGNEKNHYLLNKCRSRIMITDICWIFFGMMTANASIIATRIESKKDLARAA
jgi:transposase, IS5 family